MPARLQRPSLPLGALLHGARAASHSVLNTRRTRQGLRCRKILASPSFEASATPTPPPPRLAAMLGEPVSAIEPVSAVLPPRNLVCERRRADTPRRRSHMRRCDRPTIARGAESIFTNQRDKRIIPAACCADSSNEWSC